MSLAVWLLATAGTALILTQSTITEPLRNWLVAKANGAERAENWWPLPWTPMLAKLVSCPMCSGFWLGLTWAAVLGTRGIVLLALAAGGSIVSALGVAAWLALGEVQAALSLWRYNNQPKD